MYIFLGFKNMVADSINDQKIFNNIKIGICLTEFLKMRNYKKDKFLSECDMGKEISNLTAKRFAAAALEGIDIPE